MKKFLFLTILALGYSSTNNCYEYKSVNRENEIIVICVDNMVIFNYQEVTDSRCKCVDREMFFLPKGDLKDVKKIRTENRTIDLDSRVR